MPSIISDVIVYTRVCLVANYLQLWFRGVSASIAKVLKTTVCAPGIKIELAANWSSKLINHTVYTPT